MYSSEFLFSPSDLYTVLCSHPVQTYSLSCVQVYSLNQHIPCLGGTCFFIQIFYVSSFSCEHFLCTSICDIRALCQSYVFHILQILQRKCHLTTHASLVLSYVLSTGKLPVVRLAWWQFISFPPLFYIDSVLGFCVTFLLKSILCDTLCIFRSSSVILTDDIRIIITCKQMLWRFLSSSILLIIWWAVVCFVIMFLFSLFLATHFPRSHAHCTLLINAHSSSNHTLPSFFVIFLL
jgi:hypothetical protein